MRKTFHLCMALFIFGSLLFLVAQSARSGDLKRLDPHGSATEDLRHVDLSKHQECKTCHTVILLKVPHSRTKTTRLGLLENITDRCISCHGALPHSGVEEHWGKSSQSIAPINCLSCHRPHRAALTQQETHAQTYFQNNSSKTPSTLMMERTCEDCHKWPAH